MQLRIRFYFTLNPYGRDFPRNKVLYCEEVRRMTRVRYVIRDCIKFNARRNQP